MLEYVLERGVVNPSELDPNVVAISMQEGQERKVSPPSCLHAAARPYVDRPDGVQVDRTSCCVEARRCASSVMSTVEKSALKCGSVLQSISRIVGHIDGSPMLLGLTIDCRSESPRSIRPEPILERLTPRRAV